MNKLLIKIPTRERGLNFLAPYLDLKRSENTTFLLSLDSDDPKMQQNRKTIASLEKRDDVIIEISSSENKIHAINRDIDKYIDDFDVLLVASDDFCPVKEGYDNIILKHMSVYFPEMDGLLHYPDGYRTDLCTLPVMGVNLYKEFGYVYHPDYKSLFCDDEMHAVCTSLGKYKYIDMIIAEHRHFVNVKNPRRLKRDALYIRNDKWMKRDSATFHRRKVKGFPKQSIY